ncbi:uncharacterized protein Tco025E_03684 [Trypanosoma conorhini]|uniref:MSP domain-containing protein n=1 Tax=Trypanosoma conorhini TaxID=83891 RepID=A0A3R7NEB4_9TRYP|nr:uncharacterized protein Tco025E_03684 [Trypanosoma conorhini]RNF20926.1 hypothetical protein Tco025E_03684 [Trypanosoma conorhini]
MQRLATTPSQAVRQKGTSGETDGAVPTTLMLVEPSSLLFPPPHRNRAVQNVVVLYNISRQPCIFKVKSRTPERYYIQPHMGTISAQGAVRIRCILRPQYEDLPPATRDVFRFCLKPISSKWVPEKRRLLHGAKLKKLWDAANMETSTTVTKELSCIFKGDAAPPPGALITVLDPATIGLGTPAETAAAASPSAAGAHENDEPAGGTQEASQHGRKSSSRKEQQQRTGMRGSMDRTRDPDCPARKEHRKSRGGAGSSADRTSPASTTQQKARGLFLGVGRSMMKATEISGYYVLLSCVILLLCTACGLYFSCYNVPGAGGILGYASSFAEMLSAVDRYASKLFASGRSL